MKKILSFIIALSLFAAPAFPQGFTGMFPGPGTPASAGGGSCANNGPLDVVAETGIEAVGLRALKKTYSGMIIKISTAGTTGTYNDVGLSGCDLNTTTLSGCTTTTAPTTTTGCPIQTFYDQSGNGCNPTQATGANQAWLVVNQLNTHPTVFFGGSAFYTCTLSVAAGAASYSSEAYVTSPGSSYAIADIGNGTNFGTEFGWSNVAGNEFFNSYDGTATSSAVADLSCAASYCTYVADGPNSGAAILLRNNTAGTNGSVIGTIFTGTHFELGAVQDNSSPLQGRLGEITIIGAIGACGTASGDCLALYNNISGYW